MMKETHKERSASAAVFWPTKELELAVAMSEVSTKSSAPLMQWVLDWNHQQRKTS